MFRRKGVDDRGRARRAPAPPTQTGEHPFTLTRNGYSVTEVASFLATMSADMTTATPHDLRRVTFGVERKGYDKAEVNAYLNRLAAELDAELDTARQAARVERLTALDPSLTAALKPETIASEPEESFERVPMAAPSPPPVERVEPVIASMGADGSIIWVPVDSVDPEPVPAEPEPVAAPSVTQAASEIGDLLEAAHAMANRLRSQAEAEVRSTIDAAKAEIDERTKEQRRELGHAQAIAEQRHAKLVHEGELAAIEVLSAAEQDAARTRAAADAVLAQAKAEVEAVRALARHNLAEIEAAREETITQSRELLGLGRGMMQTIIDLDRDCGTRLARTRELIAAAALRAPRPDDRRP